MVYTQVRVVTGLHTGEGGVRSTHRWGWCMVYTQVRVVSGLHTGEGGVWSTHRWGW